ncbi:translocation/assembly module TamB domain-containing protein [Roseomonas fluvialis]|uniref:Translocation/assembly module TamB n=1 Tax=Roseomonas fluvialis TaxID=1750527 RepID=A0ABM7Y4K7_9PROT|nr:translocation/assembly module TamB domain-containing protein [Roseomonas fluvialis]BDG72817.1 translocation/assembly module TamB [Roseomonas fluvialis]
MRRALQAVLAALRRSWRLAMPWTRRILRVAVALLVGLPVLVLLLLGGALLWANTEGGRGFVARQAGVLVQGLSIEGLTGPLPGRIGVARLAMADDSGAWLEVEDAAIAFDLMALLRRDLRITSAQARRVALHRLPPATDPPPPPDPDAPLIPALPSLPVAVHLDRLAIERIELGAPVMGVAAVLTLDGSASLDAGALAARIDARRIDVPAEARLVLDLAPGADRLVARLDASEPAGGLLATALGLPDRAARARLSLDGPATGARLDLDVALGEDITLTAQGRVSAAPDGAAAAQVELRLAAAQLLPEEVRPAAMPATVTLDAAIDAARRVALRRLVLRVPAGEVTAAGSADFAAETLDITARASVGGSAVLGALVPPVARWASLSAEVHASGAMRTPRIALDAAVQGFGSDTPALAAALGETPRIALRTALPDRIESLAIDGAALRVTAEGSVGETLDATLRVVAADLAPLVPGLAGGLEAEARLTGPRADPSVALTARGERLERDGQVLEAPELSLSLATPFSAPRAEGTLRATYAGLPATLDLHGVPEGENLRLDRLAFAFGPARVDATGVVNPRAATFAGDVTLDVPDLRPFAALAGTPMAGRASLRARLDVRDGAQGFDATAELADARIAGTALDGRLAAQGTPEAFDATLEARADDARLTTRVSVTPEARGSNAPEGRGGTTPEAREGPAPGGTARRITVPELLLRRGADSLRLAAPARILLAEDGSVAIEALTITTSRGGTLRAEGRWGPETADIRATLTALPVAGLAALAAPGATVEGSIAGEARITGSVADPAARLRIEATGLRNADPAFRGLPTARVLVEGTAGARSADIRLDASAGAALRANGTARVSGGFGADAALAARLDANAELAAIAGPLLAAGAQRVTGRATLNAEATGTLGAPRLSGRATLANGSFRDLAQGVTLTDITATLRGEGDRVVIERFDARTAGGGTIAIGGTVSPAAAGLPADITLTARRARPLRSDLVSTVFDADLRLAGALLADARLSGRVQVTRMDITVPERLPAGVQTLPGVTERGRRPTGTPPLAPPAPPGSSTLPPIALEVTVEAPRAVFVRGRGIDAEFGGSLAVAGTIAAPAVSGALNLRRGSLSFFDRRLDFRRGEVSFDAGTLIPTLDFLATSRAREATINVTVTGPANDPKLEFSSTPELPQDEVLSRLLFDRRANELSPFQLAQLAQVLAGAAGLDTPSAGGILERIRRTLALDRLSVGEDRNRENTRSTGATLETGRYVADGVYLGVRQGTEGGPPRVGVQVDIAPRVRLEAETGGNSAGGDRIGLSFEWEY